MNNKPCGQCVSYHPLEKGKKGGERRPLAYGYCLKRSIFASNKPGSPVYPPRAIIEELPNAVHKLKVVKVNQVEKHCDNYGSRS